jgi:hypothetical protein
MLNNERQGCKQIMSMQALFSGNFKQLQEIFQVENIKKD